MAALAVLAGLAVQPGLAGLGAEPAGDSYPWHQDTTAEQLRQDQCLMADVLRLGGTSMATTAQDGLNKTPGQLHTLANREHWQDTALSTAYDKDKAQAAQDRDTINALRDAWQKPLNGLDTPAGFTETGFHWPPGTSNDGQQSFYEQTGLTKWISDRFWKNEEDFYKDSTPATDAATLKAVDALGTPRYGSDPDPGLPRDERDRALAEQDAFTWMHGGLGRSAGADDARIFLASGGFPRTAPQPDSAEFRIAVEDLKSRYASCAWRNPIDPDSVLGDVTSPPPPSGSRRSRPRPRSATRSSPPTRTPSPLSPRVPRRSVTCSVSPGSPTASPAGRLLVGRRNRHGR